MNRVLSPKAHRQNSNSSLDKHGRSPYLHKLLLEAEKTAKIGEVGKTVPARVEPEIGHYLQDYQLPRLANSNQSSSIERIYKNLNVFRKPYKKVPVELTLNKAAQMEDSLSPLRPLGSHSATLEVVSHTKRTKLEPLHQIPKPNPAVRSKAGTSGKQTKINQDLPIVETRLPHGIKMYCVCDGHGVNGHLVTAFMRDHLLKNLKSTLKRQLESPSLPKIEEIVRSCLRETNHQLLNSDINTELSGSTLVAVFFFGTHFWCFNVGDSRAIFAKHSTPQQTQKYGSNPSMETIITHKKSVYSSIEEERVWVVEPVSVDQKPDRKDEHSRIIQAGGRIFAQTNEEGEILGPLRVWMKELGMPGLAMTRSFGDKAGIKAGTMAEPEVIQRQIAEDDRFILLASDGVWEYLSNTDVLKAVVPWYLKEDLESAADRVVRMASESWSQRSFCRDDITVVIVALH